MGLGKHVVLSITEDVVDVGSQLFSLNEASPPPPSTRCICLWNKKDLPPEVKVDNKIQRGSFLYRSKRPVSVYQWQDSKTVHVISNYHDPQDETTVERKYR